MRNCWRGLGIVMILGTIIILPVHAMAAEAEKGGEGGGYQAPEFSVVTARDESLNLKDMCRKYRAVVVNFWGIRCSACLEELPHLNALHKRFADRIRILGVNVDGADAPTLTRLMGSGKVSIEYDLVPDPDFKMADAFKMTGAPTTVIIGADGKVRYRHEGFVPGDEKELTRKIEEILEGSP